MLGKASWWVQLDRIAVPKEDASGRDNLGDAKGEVYGPILENLQEDQVWGDWSLHASLYILLGYLMSHK